MKSRQPISVIQSRENRSVYCVAYNDVEEVSLVILNLGGYTVYWDQLECTAPEVSSILRVY